MIGRDEEDGEGMGEPRWAGVPRLPGAANLHPAQVRHHRILPYLHCGAKDKTYV